LDKTATLKLVVAKPAPPPASFTLAPPAPVTLRPGEEKSVTFTVKRDHFDEAIDLTFRALPRGITMRNAAVPAGKDSITVTVAADRTAARGVSTIKVHAAGADLTKDAAFDLTVEKAPTLSLTAPPAVEVSAGSKKAIAVRAGRDNFDGPVTVHF